MNALTQRKVWAIVLCLGFAGTGPALGQVERLEVRELASNIIMPQSREIAYSPTQRRGAVQITEVQATVEITDQVAVTTLQVHLKNTSRTRQEAEVIMPVPDKAVIRGFAFEGAAAEPVAKILPAEEARRIYNQLVAKVKDPALLEFIGYNLVRSSVFPVEPNGTQAVRLTYEHVLDIDRARIDYALPRSELLDYKVPWQVTVKIKSSHPISTVYSPSHNILQKRLLPNEILVTLDPEAVAVPGAFHLSYLIEANGDMLVASLLAYPDPKVGDNGYFMLLAGLPGLSDTQSDQPPIKREVTLVIDRSGSMAGEKIEQVRQSAGQIIAALQPTEFFNLIIYNDTIEMFSPQPVPKNSQNELAARKYLESVTAVGGTNIHDALMETLRQKPAPETLPLVLFLTDGLPTVGMTSELAIRSLVATANPYNRRIFTLGVGVDVNAPLLDKIAAETRAKSVFILPKEDVEVKVGKVFQSLSGPILADPKLEITYASGEAAPSRTRDVLPAKLPDLFQGDQLILLGRYIESDPIQFHITGNYLGQTHQVEFTFDFEKTSARNSFVPRLWAGRKIADLIDAIRQFGAPPAMATNHPRAKELVDEIIRLSTEFGILTEYTAFLAEEGTDLSDRPFLFERAAANLKTRAQDVRTGLGGISQSQNLARQAAPLQNLTNTFYDQNMKQVSIANVQQVADRAFYQRQGRWIDSRLIDRKADAQPDRIIRFGSEEFLQLAQKLIQQNRQAALALQGEILLLIDGKSVLITLN